MLLINIFCCSYRKCVSSKVELCTALPQFDKESNVASVINKALFSCGYRLEKTVGLLSLGTFEE